MDQNEPFESILLEAALKLPVDQRRSYLDGACAGDIELRRRVQLLLATSERVGEFLKSPAIPTDGRAIAPSVLPTEKPGDQIGRYKLLEKIGEGGCGVVYVADQSEPVRRRVALKVIKLGMDTKQVIARFEAERQALALMDHPNIARDLDAGATETGRPYFVMELVRGIKITEFCNENKLPTEERLKLFGQVCQAVQHAHQKGVIHRDIKPSNILVTINDDVAVPKVIDFGVAKATQGRLTDQTVYTAFEQFIGTPAYMSPEQAQMTSLDIDTRSDIYSLGVLLYELLTGKTPFDTEELLAAGLDEMRRTIREKEPVRPSTYVSTMLDAELTTTARCRRTEAPKLIHLLRGDLDWIVMKALEKDRTRRYETANGLAADVQRYLGNEPVVARPPSGLYRFQKLVRRNRLAFAAVYSVATVLVLGIAASTWQAVRASRAESSATRAWQQAEAISGFLRDDLLRQATPDESAPEEVRKSMAEILKRAARKLDQNADIAQQPELEATLRLDIGNTYFKLGIFDEAERHIRQAVALRKASASLGPRHKQTLAAQETLAWLLVGGLRSADGEQVSFETWQARMQVLGPEDRDTLDSMDTYATSLVNQKKFAEAETIYRECLGLRGKVLGTNHSDFLVTLGNLGQAFAERGNLVEAEHAVRDVIDRRTQAGHGDKTDTFANITYLAAILLALDRLDDAERLLSPAYERAQKRFGPDNAMSTLRMQHLLARIWAGQEHFEEAGKLAAEALAIQRRVACSPETTARTLLILGRVKVEQGWHNEAEPFLKEALALAREHCPSKRELLAQTANWLGAVLVARQEYPEAEKLLLSDSEQFLAPVLLSSAERRTAIGHIVKLYEAWGKPEPAAEWSKKADAFASPQTSNQPK